MRPRYVASVTTGLPWHHGVYGPIYWIGYGRGIGGFIPVDDYSRSLRDDWTQLPTVLAGQEIIQLQVNPVDEARASVGQ